MKNKMKIKKGDEVVVITGKDKMARGKVLTAMPKENRVVVEEVNKIIRHTKQSGPKQEGGRIEKVAPIDASNVMLYCKKCDKGVRVGYETKDNKKVRVCKKCKSVLD